MDLAFIKIIPKYGSDILLTILVLSLGNPSDRTKQMTLVYFSKSMAQKNKHEQTISSQ